MVLRRSRKWSVTYRIGSVSHFGALWTAIRVVVEVNIGTLRYEDGTSYHGYRKQICTTRHAHTKSKLVFLPFWSRRGRHSACYGVISRVVSISRVFLTYNKTQSIPFSDMLTLELFKIIFFTISVGNIFKWGKKAINHLHCLLLVFCVRDHECSRVPTEEKQIIVSEVKIDPLEWSNNRVRTRSNRSLGDCVRYVC